MKQITVLGGSGFLGSHLCDILSSEGHYVKIFDLKKSKWLKKNQKIYKGSILNKRKLSLAIKGSDFVYNFAGLTDLDYAKDRPIETVKSNILGTLNALFVSKKHNVKRFIHASSVYANSEEGGFYGKSKKAAEDYIEEFCKKYGLRFTILRFGSVYGERSSKHNGIRMIIDRASKDNILIYGGSRRAVRKYIHVKDAAKACLSIMDQKYENKYLTINGSKIVKIHNLMNFFSSYFKISKNKIKYLKNKAHYDIKPTLFKPREGINFSIKNPQNFKKNLIKLINE